jgi:hypothetical protein
MYIGCMSIYMYPVKTINPIRHSEIRDSECLVGFNAWSDLLFLLGISKYVYDYMTLLIHLNIFKHIYRDYYLSYTMLKA